MAAAERQRGREADGESEEQQRIRTVLVALNAAYHAADRETERQRDRETDRCAHSISPGVTDAALDVST